MNPGHGGARHDVVAARALHGGPLIGGVNPGFHSTQSLTKVERHEVWKYNWRRKLAASSEARAELTAAPLGRKLARPSTLPPPRGSLSCRSRRSSKRSRCSAS